MGCLVVEQAQSPSINARWAVWDAATVVFGNTTASGTQAGFIYELLCCVALTQLCLQRRKL